MSVMDSGRTGRERRSILPGSPMITATSRRASTSGTPQRGCTMRLLGSRTVITMMATTATAIGQRVSPTTRCACAIRRSCLGPVGHSATRGPLI